MLAGEAKRNVGITMSAATKTAEERFHYLRLSRNLGKVVKETAGGAIVHDNITLMTTLLVYGTLKRGQWNHDRFCRRAIDIRPATTLGRLYHLPAGFPALEIPDEAILTVGTGDPLADAETQARIAARDLVMPELEGDWDTVHGELITFADATRDLPPLDRLEGFRPDGRGVYRRALVAVRANTGVEAAWVYHMVGSNRGRRLSGGVWPAGQPAELR
jgi:gamma-glutamylcyclotransferase (GGCT)/AIG2-like uncharacterized protein YtfP